MQAIGVILVLCAFLFQVWVTVRAFRCTLFESSQKRTQAQLIWLLPVVGAAIVFSVISIEEANERPKKEQRG